MKHLLPIVFLILVNSVSSLAQTAVTPLEYLNGRIQARVQWEQGPRTHQESRLRVRFTDSAEQPISLPGTLKVVLWMPSMKHGSSPTTVEADKSELGTELPGVYRVSKINFLMKGDWDVRLVVEYVDRTTETRVFSLHLQ